MCDVTGHSHWIDNVRCKMHQTRLQVKRANVSFAFKTQIEICLKINANAKSQTGKSIKINVICTVYIGGIYIYSVYIYIVSVYNKMAVSVCIHHAL